MSVPAHRLPPDHPAYAPHRSTLPTVRIHCRSASKVPGRLGLPCGKSLGYVPGAAEFIATAQNEPPQPDGTIWLQCNRCHVWNRYALVPLPDAAERSA